MEVERQLEKKIKIVRSDRGGEYYMVYTQGQGKDRVHLQIFLKNKAFLLGIQCWVHLTKMVLLKGETVPLWIW
jgi:hypothetical protein